MYCSVCPETRVCGRCGKAYSHNNVVAPCLLGLDEKMAYEKRLLAEMEKRNILVVASSGERHAASGQLPGQVFKRKASSLGAAPCQLCDRTAREMDIRGVGWCREHVTELVDLIYNNSQRNKSFLGAVAKFAPKIAVKTGIKKMLLAALDEAEQAQIERMTNGSDIPR